MDMRYNSQYYMLERDLGKMQMEDEQIGDLEAILLRERTVLFLAVSIAFLRTSIRVSTEFEGEPACSFAT